MPNKAVIAFIAAIVLASVLMAVPALFRGPTTELVPWGHDFDAALGQAGAGGKLVLVDFTADWCPPCKQMKRDVFTQQTVADAIAAGFVPVKVDLTNPGEHENKLAQRFGVQAIPTLLVLKPDGEVVSTQVGGLGSGQMIDWLASAGR